MADKTLQLALRVVAEATGKQNIEQLVTELRHIEQTAENAAPATEQLASQFDSAATSATKTSTQAGELANELDKLGDQQDAIRSFEQSRTELDQQAIATAAATQALEEFRRETKSASQPTDELTRTIEQAEKSLAEMRDELTRQTTKHAALQQELRRSGIDVNNLKVAKRELGAQFNKAGKAVDGFTQDLKQGNAAQQAHAASLSNVAGKVAALATAYFGLDQVGQAVRSVFETGDKFEKLGVQMTGLMGSIAGGEKATQWIAQFTKNTPLQLGEVSQAFVKLKAFGLDPMDGTLQAITDSALKLGGGYQEVEGISLALGHAWAKQKLQGEEILQLVERGVPVWDMLQNVTGKNVEELQKLASAGKLGRDVIKQLIDEMGRTSAGSAAAQMALFSGQVSNAKDNIEQFYNLIAQSGAMDWLKAQLTELNTQFAEMAADGRLREWAQSASDAIVNAGTVIKNTITTLYEFREEIGFVAKAWLALKIGSYFSNVVSGAVAATRAFTTYKTAITSATVATQVATAATTKWRNALGFIVRGGLYTALINELVNVGVEYNNLLTIEAQVEKSRRAAQLTAAELAAEFQSISEKTGVLVTNMEELEAALDSGTIAWNEQLGIYEGVAKKQQELAEAAKQAAEAERQRAEFLKLTVPEALKVIETLESQSQSLSGVRDGVDGFIQSLESARTALQGAGDEYSQQILLIDELKGRFEAHNESLERQAYLSNDLSAAYKKLGLESSEALKKSAAELQGAFELIQQSNEPIALQQAAFLKWADSAVKAADATGEVVPASVKAAAAALGLTKELEKLIEKANQLKPATDGNSEAVERYTNALNKTRAAMENNKKILESSTATAKQKEAAQNALNKQFGIAIQQETDLAKVRELETMKARELMVEQRKLEQELAQLNQQYKTGAINAQDYQDKQDRVNGVLKVVNNLLGDVKNAQDAATNATQKGTQTTVAATLANQQHVDSLRAQQSALTEVGKSATLAAGELESYWKVSARSSAGSSNSGGYRDDRPTVETIVDYNEKNPGAYNFTSLEVQAEKARRDSAQLRDQQYARFERDIKRAKSRNQLNEIYNKIFNQLNHLEQEQRIALGELIKQQKEALNKAQTQNSAAPSPSPTQNAASASVAAPSSIRYSRIYQSPESFSQTNQPQSSDSGDLAAAVKDLVQLLTSQHSGKTIKLDLSLPGGNQAEISANVTERVLNELEKLSLVQ
ncbi:phage tail tape measure protein [Pseudoalteromonas rubra]|uniref:Phage tail tape measure protein n=1 Tax=Pseudoalteromonas rubra TaxID=43658 RepID=A0A5S3WJ65_9GAMM|nr:tape measure protein [Pseudoalteromonas rubra]TMP27207.1 phage tail tape measure protein [Pseudoalteromonas rubra]TMP29503.1 phage tail tape measure protein [Pseudoalteromonas rubra]